MYGPTKKLAAMMQTAKATRAATLKLRIECATETNPVEKFIKGAKKTTAK